jgi:hypothetical protein
MGSPSAQETSMALSEILYIIAYGTFLAGASVSFRHNGSRLAVWVMSSGIGLDFLVSMLPLLGVKALSLNLQGTNAAIIIGIALGFVVWLLYAAALMLRSANKMEWYHRMIAVVEVLWFVDFITFLYGIYKFPLQGGA